MKHVLSALVRNKAGVLAHVAGLFSARGFNIDSLSVGETESPELSRMTIVARGNDAVLEQIRKQLEKLVDVIKVIDFQSGDVVSRTLALVKVRTPSGSRSEIFDLVEAFGGKVVDITPRDLMVELVGPEKKITAFLTVLMPFGITEIARTGSVALARTLDYDDNAKG